ncbi:MAG: hypothetical protein Q9199_005514 [Rusavskia elegans]
MTINSVANAAAPSKLTYLGKLVAVRKSLTGSDLPLADLDQIIAKVIGSVQRDATIGHLDGNMALLLGQLNDIRADITAIGLDITGMNSLIEHTIALACSKMEIDRKAFALPDKAVPLAIFVVSSAVLHSKPPTRWLYLVLTSSENAIYSLFGDATNLRDSNDLFGFKKKVISALYWSESRNMIRLEFSSIADRPNYHCAVFLEMMDERGARFFLEKMSYPETGHGRVFIKYETRLVNVPQQSPSLEGSDMPAQ